MDKKNRKIITTQKLTIIIFFIILSFLNVLDTTLFLNKVVDGNNVSMQDIVIYTVYGLNTLGRVQFIDIARFSIPFIMCVIYVGTYLVDITEKGNIYHGVIRYKSYSAWIRNHIIKLALLIMMFFLVYYSSLIIIGTICTKNISGFTQAFRYLNPYMKSNHFCTLLIYQFLLSISFSILLMLIQILISFRVKDINKGFMLSTGLIITISTIGMFDIYNPIMLSKCNVLNYNFKQAPIINIYTMLLSSIIVFIILMKRIKSLVRSN